MQLNLQNNLTFGNSRKNEYTPHQIKQMRDMKNAAIEHEWVDIYTGKTFSKTNLPTIEHIIPHCLKNSSAIKELNRTKHFEIDGLDNIFPVGSLGNSARQNEDFCKTVSKEPAILTRLLDEFSKYENYKSDLIDGKTWVSRLRETLISCLAGMKYDVKTHKLIK